MPRDGSNIYHKPSGTDAVPNTVVQSAPYNSFTADVEQDLNVPRPIVAGGTAATSADGALLNLSAEKFKQVVTNWDSMAWMAGSFYAATSATGAAPVAGHAFAGVVYYANATDFVLQAVDLTDVNHPQFIRVMTGGVWGGWAADDASVYVQKAGDTMTGPLVLPGNPTLALQAAPKQYVDSQAAAAQAAATAASVAKAGDTMSGPLVLPADPTLALQAATKQYVDAGDTAAMAALTARAVRYDTAQGLTVAQQIQARANIGALKKNYIVNGAMMVAQEWPLGVTQPGFYSADQFRQDYITGGTLSMAQNATATPAGSPSRLRMTVTAVDTSIASTDILTITQLIEGLRVADLLFGTAAAKPVTIQFGVKAPAGTYGVSLHNSGNTRSYTTTFTIAAGEANTDVVKSVTIPGDTTGTWLTDTGIGFGVSWCLMGGSGSQTAGGAWSGSNFYTTSAQFNWMGTFGNVFDLFDVGLYEGAVAPPFQVPDYASELQLCQRYWYATNQLTPRGAVVGAVNAPAGGVNFLGASIKLGATMRVAPTVTLWNNNVQNQVRNTGTGGVVAVTPSSFNGSVNNLSSIVVASGLVANTLYDFDIIANARM